MDWVASSSEALVRAVEVPDSHVQVMSELYCPKKTTFARVEYVDLAGGARRKRSNGEHVATFFANVRSAAALVHVVDGFSIPEAIGELVEDAIHEVDTELAIADLEVCERRIARLDKEGTKSGAEALERVALVRAAVELSEGRPLRLTPEIANSPELRSFSLLSAKPVVTVVNTAESQPHFDPRCLPEKVRRAREGAWGRFVALCGELEAELATLAPQDARAFLADFGIDEPARELVIRESFEMLGLMPFYTVGADEVRAWTIPSAATAEEAAGVIHTDIARGFIRAEVVGCESLIALAGFENARKKGKVRLEGKSYRMRSGDVVNFRFNV